MFRPETHPAYIHGQDLRICGSRTAAIPDDDAGLILRRVSEDALARVCKTLRHSTTGLRRGVVLATRSMSLDVCNSRFMISANTAAGGFEATLDSSANGWQCEIGCAEAETAIARHVADEHGNTTYAPSLYVSWSSDLDVMAWHEFNLADVDAAADGLARCMLDWHAWAVEHAKREGRQDWLVALGHQQPALP